MKGFFLVLSALSFVGCDLEKATQSASETSASENPNVSAATPTPVPKPGDWMWKKYKNPLDAKKTK